MVPLDAAANAPANVASNEATPVAVPTPSAPLAPAAVPSLPVAPVAETVKGPSTGLVVFNPTAASWVEVTDAQGTVLLRRMLAAGEVAGASGALPLSAVVGRADVTRVQVRGQPLDLAPIARDNVARFEVK